MTRGEIGAIIARIAARAGWPAAVTVAREVDEGRDAQAGHIETNTNRPRGRAGSASPGAARR